MAQCKIVNIDSYRSETYYNPEKNIASPWFGVDIFHLGKLFRFYHTTPVEQYERFISSASPTGETIIMDLLISPPPAEHERLAVLRCFDEAIKTFNPRADLHQMSFGNNIYILDEAIGEFKQGQVVIEF